MRCGAVRWMAMGCGERDELVPFAVGVRSGGRRARDCRLGTQRSALSGHAAGLLSDEVPYIALSQRGKQPPSNRQGKKKEAIASRVRKRGCVLPCRLPAFLFLRSQIQYRGLISSTYFECGSGSAMYSRMSSAKVK